jgi:DNA-binding SARP family transcriptional activator
VADLRVDERRTAARPALLERPALQARLDEAFGKRLTLVVAGAGFGKSTLLGQWASDVSAAWYSLGPEDRTLSALTRGVSGALRSQVPEIARRFAEAVELSQGRSGEDRLQAETFAAGLCEAFQDSLGHDFMLIFDDLHELESAPGPARFLEMLCRQAPPTLHLVVASRAGCPFPTARLRAQGEVLELVASELAFSRTEVSALLSSAVGDDVDVLAGPVYEGTAGWPVAVRLAVESLRRAPPDERGAVVASISRPQGPLFSYLAEEVFGRADRSVRRLLPRIAQLDRFTPELCEAVGVRNAARVLGTLTDRGLMIRAEGGVEGWLTLHALIRDFVLQTWPLPAEALEELHRLAADWFVERGDFDGALRSLAAGATPSAKAGFLASHGAEALARGFADGVIEVGEPLPVELRDARADEILGDAYTIRGNADLALHSYRRAAGDAAELPARLAWRTATIHYLAGELDAALDVVSRARMQDEQPRDESLVLTCKANILRLRGDAASGRLAADRALEAAISSGDAYALADAHNALGNLAELEGAGATAETHYRKSIEAAEKSRDVHQLAREKVNVSSQLCVAGQYDEALDELDDAIPLTELAGFGFVQAYGLAFRGLARFALGRPEEAITDYQEAIELWRKLGSPTWASIPLGHLGDVYRERGDLALARTCYEEAVSLAEQAEDVQGLVPALSGLARVLVREDPAAAEAMAERAAGLGKGWGHVSAVLAAGWVALALGREERSRRLALEAAEAARAGRDRAGLAESLELRALAAAEPGAEASHLEEALRIWREMGHVLGTARAELALSRLSTGPTAGLEARQAERKLRAAGVRPDAAARAAGVLASLPHAEPDPVAIVSLGGFSVLRRAEPVPHPEWQSRKARDLVKLLVARRGRPVAREVLMEALWPGEEPAQLSSRFSVLLSIVRSVLDPEKAFDAQYFLKADKEAVTLQAGHLAVDVDAFLRLAAEGFRRASEGFEEEGERQLELAESTYAGDFLEEDLYADWATPLREEARATYVKVARELAERAIGREDYDGAARYLLRLLERDPHDEQAHLRLVSSLLRARRHGDARQRYRAYVERMRELELEPAPFPAQP